MLALLAFYALSIYLGSFALVVPYLQGEHYVVSPTVLDLGDCSPGTVAIGEFAVTSLVSRPIRVIGSVEGCQCVTVDRMPITVEARGTRVISIKVIMPTNSTDFAQSAILYFDDGDFGSVSIHIKGRIAERIAGLR